MTAPRAEAARSTRASRHAPRAAAAGARPRTAPPEPRRRRPIATEPTGAFDRDRLCLLDRLEEVGGDLLTREEEVLLSRLARDAVAKERGGPRSSGDDASLAARNELVVRNIRLAVWLAKKHTGRGLPLEDLVQEGTLGLIRAASKFDPESGNRFSTYATWWVRQAMGRALADKGRTVRLPVHFREKLHKVLKCRDDLAALLEREPDDEEIARHLKKDGGQATSSWWTAERVGDVRRSAQDTLVDSLDRPLAGREGTAGGRRASEDDAPLGSFVPDAGGDADPLESACHEEAMDSLGEALGKLPARERRVLGMRYGLDGGEPATLGTLAEELGMSRQGVQALQARAEGRLKRHLLAASVAGRASAACANGS